MNDAKAGDVVRDPGRLRVGMRIQWMMTTIEFLVSQEKLDDDAFQHDVVKYGVRIVALPEPAPVERVPAGSQWWSKYHGYAVTAVCDRRCNCDERAQEHAHMVWPGGTHACLSDGYVLSAWGRLPDEAEAVERVPVGSRWEHKRLSTGEARIVRLSADHVDLVRDNGMALHARKCGGCATMEDCVVEHWTRLPDEPEAKRVDAAMEDELIRFAWHGWSYGAKKTIAVPPLDEAHTKQVDALMNAIRDTPAKVVEALGWTPPHCPPTCNPATPCERDGCAARAHIDGERLMYRGDKFDDERLARIAAEAVPSGTELRRGYGEWYRELAEAREWRERSVYEPMRSGLGAIACRTVGNTGRRVR